MLFCLSFIIYIYISGITYVGLTFQIGKLFGPIVQVSHPSKSFLVLLRDNRELSVTIPPKSFLTNVWVRINQIFFRSLMTNDNHNISKSLLPPNLKQFSHCVHKYIFHTYILLQKKISAK